MEKKYIIKLEENEIAYKTVNSNGCPMIGLLHPAPYTEHLEQIRKEAYEKGWKEAEAHYEKGYNDGYDTGLSHAWEAARKIIHMPEADLLDLFTECYSAVCTSVQVFLKYDASECIEKIRQYEQGKEIKVGDEVDWMGDKCVVTYIRCKAKKADLISCKFGNVCENVAFGALVKTGRHFPEIAVVLEKMREV